MQFQNYALFEKINIKTKTKQNQKHKQTKTLGYFSMRTNKCEFVNIFKFTFLLPPK